MNCRVKKYFHFVYPLGKPMPPQLLRCQGLAVDDYSFALGRLEAGAPSTFAQLEYNIIVEFIQKNLKFYPPYTNTSFF